MNKERTRNGDSLAKIWHALEAVADPEIPVISVVELGIVRDVQEHDGEVVVHITPTFSGCPALDVIAHDVKQAVSRLGVKHVKIEMVLSPPWTSDWISAEGRRKLKGFGLAPPKRHGGNISVTFFEPVSCPYCGSDNTILKNAFGPTLCRSIHYCNACDQPFEQFKAL